MRTWLLSRYKIVIFLAALMFGVFIGKYVAYSTYTGSPHMNLLFLGLFLAMGIIMMLGYTRTLLLWVFLGLIFPFPLMNIPGFSEKLFLYHIFVGFLGTVYVFSLSIKGRLKVLNWKSDLYLLFFLFFAFLSFLFSFFLQDEITKYSFTNGAAGLILLVVPVATYFIISLNIRKKKIIVLIVMILLLSGMANFVLAQCFSTFSAKESISTSIKLRNEARKNLQGLQVYQTMRDASYSYRLSMGFAVQMLFFLALPLALSKKLTWRLRALPILFVLFYILRTNPAYILIGGRSAIFALLAGSLSLISFSKYRLKLYAILLILLTVLILFNFNTFQNRFFIFNFLSAGRTFAVRLSLWANGLTSFLQSPVLGIGPGGFGRVSSTISPTLALRHADVAVVTSLHNSWLQVLVEEGLIGFFLVMAFLVSLLKKAVQYIKIAKNVFYRQVIIGLLSAIVSASIYALGGSYIFPSATGGGWTEMNESIYFWILLGILSATLKMGYQELAEPKTNKKAGDNNFA